MSMRILPCKQQSSLGSCSIRATVLTQSCFGLLLPAVLMPVLNIADRVTADSFDNTTRAKQSNEC